MQLVLPLSDVTINTEHQHLVIGHAGADGIEFCYCIHQLTFADSEFNQKRRKNRKEIFLGRMDNLIPWKRLEKIITPHYPKAGKGRRPYPLSTML
ncbi:hypothetical protein SAMN03080615_01990 [Amphritea atlantica]|uniref:Transposase InsH N-terminal domain-containing protein n=1 Tax=Amphritea atlantica TaxID=355243 RepID=A0A1H9H7T4_9GAMM|nr:hypothetical protein SAMN03080615_01990 [Amphritea atlantica]